MGFTPLNEIGKISSDNFTPISNIYGEDFDEDRFQEWYAEIAKPLRLDPDPDAPEHHYDYRAFYQEGLDKPDAPFNRNKRGERLPVFNPNDLGFHFDSKHKADDHPNRFVESIDTKIDTPIKGGFTPIESFGRPTKDIDIEPQQIIEQPSIPEQAIDVSRQLGESVIGGFEALAQTGGGFVEFLNPIPGIVGIASAIRNRDLDKATQSIQEVQEAMRPYLVYEPKTEAGRGASGVVQGFLDWLISTPARVMGETAQDITGSATVGALTNVVTELAGFATLFGIARGGRGRRRITPRALKPEEFEQHLVDTAKVIQKALPEGTVIKTPKALPGGVRVDFNIVTKPKTKIRKPTETTFYRKEGDKLVEYTPEELKKIEPLEEKIRPIEKVEPSQQPLIEVQPKFPEGRLKPKVRQKEEFELIDEVRKRKIEVKQMKIPTEKGITVRKTPQPRPFNPETDSLVTFIRKRGGIKTEDTGLRGDFKDLDRPDLINNKIGLFPDHMREIANEAGFGPFDTIAEFIDATRADVFARAEGKKGGIWSKAKQEFDDFGDIVELHAGIPVHRIIPKKFRARWQEFWKPFSTVPEGEKALFARSRQFGDIGKAEGIVQKMHDKLDKFELEARKDIFRYLDGTITLLDLPPDARATARSIQQRTITIGKMLVKRGIIPKETFEAHKGKYIHYMFAKHILGDREVGLNPSGKLNLSYTKARNPNLTTQERQALGLIDDASVAVPVGMGKALTDVAKFDYLERVSKNPNWTWEPSIIDLGEGRKIGIGKLVEDVSIYRKLIEQDPSNIAIRDRFEFLNEHLQRAIAEVGQAPEGFIQLPTTSTYGPLAGAFIRKPIADDLIPLFNSVSGGKWGETVNTLLSVEQQGMALFKATHVALNFPTAFRNVISNILQNNMRGRPLQKIPKDFINAVESVKAKDRHYVEAKRNGLFRTNWTITEINEILNEFAKIDTTNWGSFMGVVKDLAKYYGKIDDFSKHTIFVQLRKEGVPVSKAIVEAQKWGMDYSLASRSIKGLRRHFVPFISYQYKIAPLIAESLQKRPWVIGKYATLPFIAQEVAKQMNDITEKEWEKLEKELPLYIKKNKTFMVLPVKDPDGRWQWVNVEYYFPWGNWMAIYRDLNEQDFKGLAEDAGIGNPFLDILQAFKSGVGGKPPKDPYTGQPLYNELDSPQEQWLKISEFLYNKWAPSMLTRYGAAGYTSRIGDRDKWGRKITKTQAIGRWFGFNIISISPKQTKVIKRAMINDLRKELFKISRDPSISKEKKKAAKERFKEKRKEILEGKP